MLSDRLRRARLKCGLTQQQVADLLKVDRSCYTYYETGKSRMTTEMLKSLAAIFGTEFYLLADDSDSSMILHDDSCLKPYKDDDTPVATGSIEPDERKLLAQIRLIRQLGKSEELEKYMDEITGTMFRDKFTGDYDEEL